MQTGNSNEQKSTKRRIVVPIIVLIIWTSVIVAALINQWNTGGNLIAFAIIIGIGGFGIYGIARSVIRQLTDPSNQP